VATYRDPEGIGELVVLLVREGQLVALGGLGRNEVKDLIEVLSGEVPSQAQVAVVYQRTEGNPLFVREVVRLQAADANQGRPPGTGGISIPGSVRAVIGRRLAPASPSAVGRGSGRPRVRPLIG
jgi:hypothetical protein